MQPMNIGRMNQRIEIFGNILKEDEMGQSVNELVLFKKVWADVTPKSGTEKTEAGEVRAETSYRVRIRYIPGITQDMLLCLKGKWMEIRSIINLYERNRTIEMDCVEYFRKGESDVGT